MANQSEQILKSVGELREIAVFAALSPEELGAIAETAERQVLQRGSLISGDDAADFVYAIIHGEVRLSLVSLQGREIMLYRRGRGDLFELLGDDRAETPELIAEVATEGTVLYSVSWPNLLAILLGTQNAATRLAVSLLEDIVVHRRLLMESVFCETSERLAHALAAFGRHTPDQTVSLTRDDLAAAIGSRREDVTKILTLFRDRGLVQYQPYGRRVQIIDLDALEEYRARPP